MKKLLITLSLLLFLIPSCYTTKKKMSVLELKTNTNQEYIEQLNEKLKKLEVQTNFIAKDYLRLQQDLNEIQWFLDALKKALKERDDKIKKERKLK